MIIKILNLEKLIKQFGDLADIDMMPPIRIGARKVQRSAKDFVAVDTGTLKGSINVKHFPKEQSSVIFTVTEYGIHQEFGTRHQAGTPFMVPAMNKERAGIKKDMKAYLENQLKLRAGK